MKSAGEIWPGLTSWSRMSVSLSRAALTATVATTVSASDIDTVVEVVENIVQIEKILQADVCVTTACRHRQTDRRQDEKHLVQQECCY